MRNLLTLLLGTILLLSSCKRTDIAHYRAYPSVKEVVTEFRNTVHVRRDDKTYLDLAKKPGGWYIVRKNRQDAKAVNEYLFWSAETKKYVAPGDISGKNPGEGDDDLDNVLGVQYSYDHSIFFGYEKWSNDVIDALEGGDLNDTLLESLARAYADKSMAIVRPSDASKRGNHTPLSEDDMQLFCEWGDKEIKTYQRLQEMNPEYETIVGLVGMKIGNTFLYMWSELNTNGYTEKANGYLPDGIYNKVELNFAKNMLQSADKDAIIFTYGDNDTYPTWYVQEHLGIRKDVAVINLSLANVPDWVFYWKRRYKLELSRDEKFYRDTMNEFVALSHEKRDMQFLFSQLTDGMAGRSQEFVQEYNGNRYLASPVDHFVLSAMHGDSTRPIASFDNSNYLQRNDLVVMDLLASNKRPFYFSATVGSDGITGAMHDYLVGEGLLRKMVENPLFSGAVKVDGDYYNEAALRKNLGSAYVYGIAPGSRISNSGLVQNYFYLYHSLFGLQLDKGDSVSAKKTLDECMKNISPEANDNPNMLVFLGEDYLRLTGQTKGRQLEDAALALMRKRADSGKHNDELERFVSLTGYVKSLAERYSLANTAAVATVLKEDLEKKVK